MKKNVVYAVERGSYSDYEVVALFSNKAAAKECAKKVGGEVVTRTVYDEVPAPTPYYVVERGYRRDGQGESELETFLIEDWDGPRWIGRMIRGVAFHQHGNGLGQGVRVWGTNKEGVIRRWQEFLDAEAMAALDTDEPIVIRGG